MSNRRTLTLTVLALTFLVSALGSPLYAQTPPALLPTPISDDAYAVLVQMFDYDGSVPLDPMIINQIDGPDGLRQSFVFTGWHQRRVPGLVALPKGGAKPYPLVLLIHGITGNKASWFEPPTDPRAVAVIPGAYALASALLRSGFAILALDAEYHGERVAEEGYVWPGTLARPQRSAAGREMLFHSTIDYRRAMDYVATRAELDQTRIGALGFSMGGMMTFYLAAVDSRIRAGVAWSAPDQRVYPLLSVFNFAQRIRTQPFLLLMGRSDAAHSPEAAQHLLRLLSTSTKQLTFFEGGHQLRVEDVPTAVAWLEKHLR